MVPRPSLGRTPFSLSAWSTLLRRTSYDETTHRGHLCPHPTFSINTSLLNKLKAPQNFKEKPEISLSLSLSLSLLLVIGRCLWCLGPPSLNSLEEIAWSP